MFVFYLEYTHGKVKVDYYRYYNYLLIYLDQT